MKRFFIFFLILSWGALFFLSPYYAPYVDRGFKKIQRILKISPSVKSPSISNLPRFIPRKRVETATWYNGITLNSKLETQTGRSASQERIDAKSYRLDLTLNLKMPKASRDLTQLNPRLAAQWPELIPLVSNATVSVFYEGLYQRKLDWLNTRLIRLDQLLSRHNFYDCDTILEFKAPLSQRKLLLIQSEMDVVSDGSDSDRQIILPTNTANYQPFTSYRWLKQTTNQSPFLAIKQTQLKTYQTEFSTNVVSLRRQTLLRSIDELKREIHDLERYSYLVASLDPFIVLPGFMFRDPNSSYQPKVGDYAVVMCQGQFYPAIVGDVGPSDKIGEASLHLAQAINPASTSYQRPVSDLQVSYLVFLGSAEAKSSAPDLKQWREKCLALLNEIGSFSGQLQ